MSARTILSIAILSLSLSTAASAQQLGMTDAQIAKAKQEAAAEEGRIQAKLAWLDQQLAKEDVVLRQKLKRAEDLRTAGIKNDDSKQIREAEALEQKAFDFYEKRLAVLEEKSADLSKAEKKAPTKKKAQPRSSNRFLRLFGN
jgi:hypothetical protein